MSNRPIRLTDVVRVPYYETGIGNTLLCPARGEGTFSAGRLDLLVGPVTNRTCNGHTLRVVQVLSGPHLRDCWIDIDRTPGLAEQLGETARPSPIITGIIT